MVKLAKDITKQAMIVGFIPSTICRKIKISTNDIAVLNFLTALIDFIELELKEESKRLKNQIKDKIQAICYGFKTWSLISLNA